MNTIDLRPYAPSWLHRQSVRNRINWPVLLGYGLVLVVGVGFWVGVYLKFFKG